MKKFFEELTGLKLDDIPETFNEFGGHEKGKKYFCGYWRQVYEVLECNLCNDWRRWEVVCRWEDGHVTSHCTRLCRGKDFLVLE